VLSDGISIPVIAAGYTAWLPEGRPRGMIVFFHARRDTAEADFLIRRSLDHHLAVMFVTTENRLDFFFGERAMNAVNGYLEEVLAAGQVPREHLLYCGMSLEGTRALRLALYGLMPGSGRPVPQAVAVCDAPLDMIRFYDACDRAKRDNFNDAAANEGLWVTGTLRANLGGTPLEAGTRYMDYSPFCYRNYGGERLDRLLPVAVRAYTEPDVNWWIDNRRKDYYGMNAVDMAALINELRRRGSDRAELITTTGKGVLPDGSRHPHSWSIVDEAGLVDWFSRLAGEE